MPSLYYKNGEEYKQLTASDLGGAVEGHTHDDIVAVSANKLNANAGSGTKPVYFANGVPTECSFTVATSVPSDAKFTDTNTTYSAGTGIGLSGTTFSNAGVRSIATGTSNGTISVNTNGSTANVSVYGLGTAAYTASTAYATSGHTHTAAAVGAATWETIYPVGAVYISYVSTSPATLFGGTWTQITGRFLRMANDVSTGGADTHTLTTAQLPSHRHYFDKPVLTYSSGLNAGVNLSGTSSTGWVGSDNSLAGVNNQTSAEGSGSSHNNMPAYQDLYAWRRTK